jgi:hypothetical protein
MGQLVRAVDSEVQIDGAGDRLIRGRHGYRVGAGLGMVSAAFAKAPGELGTEEKENNEATGGAQPRCVVANPRRKHTDQDREH